MKGIPRDRIVKIKKIFDEPKVLAEKDTYNFYSFGIKLEDGSYANINVSASNPQEAKEKANDKFIINKETNERIKEGQTYKVYEESTDEENKYWRVVAFVKISEGANKIDEEDALPPMEEFYDATHSTDLHSETDDAKSQGGGTSSANGARTGMLFKLAVELCIAENKTKDEDIEIRFNSLRNLLNKLERGDKNVK